MQHIHATNINAFVMHLHHLHYSLYNGQRNSLSILTWITTFFPKKIQDLNFSDYQKILDSKHMWLVHFYLPHCWHCQKMEPEFAITAQVYATLLDSKFKY